MMVLLALVVLPIAAGFALYALPRADRTLAKGIATGVAAVTFLAGIALRDQSMSVRWLARPFTAAFHFADDGIGFWIALLLALCTLCAVLAANVPRLRDFLALMLLLEGAMMGVFLARDLLVFALFWDLMLVPVFLGLLGWGEHPSTAWRYLIYNFAGGLTLLLSTAAFGVAFGSTDVIGRSGLAHLGYIWGPWIFAGFAFAFLVKTPIWPLHTWMPPTYSDTPPPMVAVVSAVQSKAGLYGFIVVGMALLPEAMHAATYVMLWLGLISLLYGGFVALVQTDAKRIVAYSSLSHLGLILVAIFSFNALALRGALIYVIAHGLFNAVLFLVLGFIEEREETRSLPRLGGLARANPKIAGAFAIGALAALGLPGLIGFAGELIMLTGIFSAGYFWPALIALVPIVLAAAYMLRLFQDIMQGPEIPDVPIRRDLTLIEGLAVAPLVLAMVFFGVNPHALTTFDTTLYVSASELAP
ncbi:MAG: NADH-quinone oxidoreductase subunit M [Candidatus Eremiobacteraeota bacterium]|nr:NADH-quinone oxidoreductase subunit M [Candidatus Eremiobacteraeota bacterium]